MKGVITVCRCSNTSNINHIRLELINKGFITIKDIQKFCACGYPKAKMMYEEIVAAIKKEKKKISPMGISTQRLLKYLDLSEEDIRKYVEDENNRFLNLNV